MINNALSQRAKEIVEKIIYITIATCSKDGQPWNSPVYSAFDENHTFYWGSDKNSQHSKNIAANNKVFLVIYDSTVPAGTGEGVYIKAKAGEVTDKKEMEKVVTLLKERAKRSYWKVDQLLGEGPHLYKAILEKAWMNGEGKVDGVYIDTREEVSLK